MDEPIVELAEFATPQEVRQAAEVANTYADQLQREVWRWRNLGTRLSDKADEMSDTPS
jgi:hypothetical protein